MATVTAYSNGNITLTTNANTLLSPMVVDYTPTSEINTTSALIETVTMTGIDRVFKYHLSEPDSIKLLNSFTVSGFKMDPTLGEKDPNMESLAVALSASGDFAEVIRTAIEGATDYEGSTVNASSVGTTTADGDGAGIKQYLETRLRNAFYAYFGSSMGQLILEPGWASFADGSVMHLSGTNAGVSAETYEGQVEASGANAQTANPAVTIASTQVLAETTLTGFTVDVDVSEDAMAAAAAARHGGVVEAENRRILFRQIRKATWEKYYDGSGDRLNTNALPMEKGQSFVILFDIDIKNSDSRKDSGALGGNNTEQAETLPTIDNSQSGNSSYQLNMGNRRVAFELQLEGAVGQGIFALRADTGKVLAPGYVAPAPVGPPGL